MASINSLEECNKTKLDNKAKSKLSYNYDITNKIANKITIIGSVQK